MKKRCFSRVFAIFRHFSLRPFGFTLVSVAFLSLFARPAYAQPPPENPRTINLLHLLEQLRQEVNHFEMCQGHGHIAHDLIIYHQQRAQTCANLVLYYPLASNISFVLGFIPFSVMDAFGNIAATVLIDFIVYATAPGTYGEAEESLITCSLTNARQAFEMLERYPCARPQLAPPTYNAATATIGTPLSSTTGAYTANDGGAEGAHRYRWFSADNADRTGNLTLLAETKDYTPVGADFGKYLWLETTPVGANGLSGIATPGEVVQVGVTLKISVTGGAGGANPQIGKSPAGEGVVIYGPVLVSFSPIDLSDTVLWTANPQEGVFGDATAASTTYTPAATPSAGTMALSATLSPSGSSSSTDSGHTEQHEAEKSAPEENNMGNADSSGCNTVGGPFGLVAFAALMFVRRRF